MKKIILVSLIVTCSCSKKDPVPVPAPVADFSFAVDSQFAPVKVSFTNKSTNQVTSFWDFGDVTSSSELNPTHTYTTAKTYTVTLKVINSKNVINSVTKTITILNPLPIADFSFTPDNAFAPLKITFTNKSINQTASAWDFGDGTTSFDASPSHVFTTGKVFTITLKTTNADNATNTTTKTVTVLDVPTKMKLNSVVLTSIPFTAYHGYSGWDVADGPDVYCGIGNTANTVTLLMTGITNNLSPSGLPLTISSNLPTTFQDVNYNYSLGIYDYDAGFAPEVIAVFLFKAKDYMPNDGSKYPSKIDLSVPGPNAVGFILNVEWLP